MYFEKALKYTLTYTWIWMVESIMSLKNILTKSHIRISTSIGCIDSECIVFVQSSIQHFNDARICKKDKYLSNSKGQTRTYKHAPISFRATKESRQHQILRRDEFVVRYGERWFQGRSGHFRGGLRWCCIDLLQRR